MVPEADRIRPRQGGQHEPGRAVHRIPPQPHLRPGRFGRTRFRSIKKLEILFTAETQRAVRNQAAKEEGKKLLAKGKEPRGGADGGRGAFNRDKKTIAKPIRKAD